MVTREGLLEDDDMVRFRVEEHDALDGGGEVGDGGNLLQIWLGPNFVLWGEQFGL